jgi:hypothetical protein
MPIKRHGDPKGKPKKRPRARRQINTKKGESAPDIRPNEGRPDRTKRSATSPRIGRRIGDLRGPNYDTTTEQAKKSQEIERRHKKAQKERMAARKNRKRLKKKGKVVSDRVLRDKAATKMGL